MPYVADKTPEFHAGSTDISSVNLADDVAQVGSGDSYFDHYSLKTQGMCLALATGFYIIMTMFFCRVSICRLVSSVIALFERCFEPAHCAKITCKCCNFY